eukprot:scaffold5520_cov167-Amphora_coffeaeformis.AAC.4
MGIIGGENNRHVTRLECLDRCPIRGRIDRIIGRKSIARQIHVPIDIANILLHVIPNTGKLLPIDPTHADPIYFGTTAQVKHGQRHDTCTLVTVGGSPTHVARGVFASPDHQYVGFFLCHDDLIN